MVRFKFGRETGGSLLASKEQLVAREREKQRKLALETNRLRKQIAREKEIKQLQRQTRVEKTQYLKERREFEVAKKKERVARRENWLINRLPSIGVAKVKVKKKKRPTGKGKIRIF